MDLLGPTGALGDGARERVRQTYETTAAPTPALLVADVFGPPTTASDAGISLALAAIPVGKLGKATLVADDAVKYAGVREMSATLKAAGYSHAQRVEAIQAFKVTTIAARSAGPDETVVRAWGGSSLETGRWFSRADLAADARHSLALPPGNTAEHLTEFGLEPGTRYFEGTAARNFDQPGGAIQIMVPDTSGLWVKHRWR